MSLILLVTLFLLASKHLYDVFHLHFRIFFLSFNCTLLVQVLAETCSVFFEFSNGITIGYEKHFSNVIKATAVDPEQLQLSAM